MGCVCTQIIHSRHHFGLPHSRKANKTFDLCIGGPSTKYPAGRCHPVLPIPHCIKFKMLTQQPILWNNAQRGVLHMCLCLNRTLNYTYCTIYVITTQAKS